MPQDIIVNRQITTLAAPMLVGDTTMTLAAPIGPSSGPGQFRVVVDAGLPSAEIVVVTAGFGTTSLTVIRGVEGPPLAHVSGIGQVITELTAGALNNQFLSAWMADGITPKAPALDTGALGQTKAGALAVQGLLTASSGINASGITLPAASIPESVVTNLTSDLAARALDSTVLHNNATAESKSGSLTVPVWDKGGAEFNVRAFGAVGDGATDDTAALQAAANATPAGGVCFFPQPSGSGYLITTTITVPRSMTFRGTGQYTCRIIASGCNGVTVAAGVSSFGIMDMEVALAVRYTTTTNTLIGINQLGTTGSRAINHVYHNVYVDGFRTAMVANWLSTSVFNNFREAFGLIGIQASGLCVNNVVTGGSQFLGSSLAGSRGIFWDGVQPSQGWVIDGFTLVDSKEISLHGIAVTYITVSDSFLDHCVVNAIVMTDNGVNFAGCWDVHNTYMAVSGAGNDNIVKCVNSVSNAQNVGNRFTNNNVLAYGGSTVQNAFGLTGTQSVYDVVQGNNISGAFANAMIQGAGAGKNQSAIGNVLNGSNKAIGGMDFVDGNVGNPLRVGTTNVVRIAAAGAAPTVTAGANNGTTPPAPTATGNDTRMTISCGSGTTPAAGAQIVVTFATAYAVAPVVTLTPANAATAALQPYVSSVTTAGYTLSTGIAPAASQAAGTYSASATVIG